MNVASIPKPTHDAAWWEAQTKGFDFSQEDRVPTELFNRVIWRGLKGATRYPTFRSGADLRQHREQLLKTTSSHTNKNEQTTNPGGEQVSFWFQPSKSN